MIVTKFGGSSLADAGQFEKVRNIVFSDPRRRIVVPSAPGKRFAQDEKITDLLYLCHHQQKKNGHFEETFSKISERYLSIAKELSLTLPLSSYLDEIRDCIAAGASPDYCASRGEYLNALLLADYLQFEFLDAAKVIFFDALGQLDHEKTNQTLASALDEGKQIVLPGFYGSNPEGKIQVFSRGGSDITGALAARAAQAELYENWTDVSGFLMADPRIVSNPRHISHVTYQEMHELSRAGASVLHEDSVFPVNQAGIPTNIRNTNRPEDPGTMITKTAMHRKDFSIFAGIAGKKGFSLLTIDVASADSSYTAHQKVLQVVKNCGLSFQYLPSTVHTISLMTESESYAILHEALEYQLAQMGLSCSLSVKQGFASIVLVGYGIIHNRQTVNRIFATLQKQQIPIAMLNQSSGELSTWVAVEESQMEHAICSLYEEFSDS